MAIYDDKIIPIDAAAAALAGRLEAKAISAGHDPGMADAMIAGIAQAQALTIVTHNTKPFAPFGVGVATPDGAVELASGERWSQIVPDAFFHGVRHA